MRSTSHYPGCTSIRLEVQQAADSFQKHSPLGLRVTEFPALVLRACQMFGQCGGMAGASQDENRPGDKPAQSLRVKECLLDRGENPFPFAVGEV